MIFGFLELRGRILGRRIFFVVVLRCRIFLGGFYVVLVVLLFLVMRFVFVIFRDLDFRFCFLGFLFFLFLELFCYRSFLGEHLVLRDLLLGLRFLGVGVLVRCLLRIGFVCL